MNNVQGWAKELNLGCVNPASWLPLASGGEFMQPTAHLLADPCIVDFISGSKIREKRQ